MEVKIDGFGRHRQGRFRLSSRLASAFPEEGTTQPKEEHLWGGVREARRHEAQKAHLSRTRTSVQGMLPHTALARNARCFVARLWQTVLLLELIICHVRVELDV